MQFKRRDALKVFGGATLATLVDPAFAKAKPQRVLILGGTGFIGPHFVNALKDGGHSLTLFNRGKRDPDADPGIEQLIGDRNGQIDALKGRDWDAVIDNSAYTPKQVRLTELKVSRCWRKSLPSSVRSKVSSDSVSEVIIMRVFPAVKAEARSCGQDNPPCSRCRANFSKP